MSSVPSLPWLIPHIPMDNSVTCLDAEEITYSRPFDYQREIERAMAWRSVSWLTLHYPEMVFAHFKTRRIPKGHALKVYLGKGNWVVADWRTAGEKAA